ncbi:MAG: diaminopimelate decarboxylase [Ruminococcaceae bacterium]|nr:diaminopimelate decarboxylase [Oscillospiraceae bacterium]
MSICENITVNEQGRLCFAGRDTAELAAEFKTPLYLLDEDRIRHNCRVYKAAMAKHFSVASRPLYASKAASFKAIYRIMSEEGMGVDVVSCGEIYTAWAAGFDMSLAYYHGSNKTDENIRYAMDKGVGTFVVDNLEELLAVDAESARRGRKQEILLRITPGIDPHTYAAIATGKVDSKFGSAIATGQAESLTVRALGCENVDLMGFHCHVGSQVFAEDVFERAAVVMLEFAAEMKAKHGFVTRKLDLGGGYGVRYVEEDPFLDIEEKIAAVAAVVHESCGRLGIAEPDIFLEPGRSIVADAGMTLYTVGSVKCIPGYKNYVSVDGGMTDNPRFALYGSRYTCLAAEKMNEATDFACSLVGHCCESGDILQEGVHFPSGIRRGDLVAVCTTGAYNYAMSSHYNRVPRPPVVMLSEGEARVVVRGESVEDVAAFDV